MNKIDKERNKILNIMNSITDDNTFALIELSSNFIKKYMAFRIDRSKR